MPRVIKNKKTKKRAYRKNVRIPQVDSTKLNTLYGALGSGGIASQRMVTLRGCYSDMVLINANNPGTLKYCSCNSLVNNYNYSFTAQLSHEPHGYNQWKNLYKKYMVMRSRCVVHVTTYPQPGTGDNPHAIIATLRAQDRSDAPLTNQIDTVVERPHTSYGIFDVNAQKPEVVLRCNFDSKEYYQFKDYADNYTRFGAEFDVEPIERADFTLQLSHSIFDATQPAVRFYVLWRVEYDVLFADPRVNENS